MKLKKRFGIPWICDIRDYWISHFTYQYSGSSRERQEQNIEKSFFKFANHISTVSQGVKKEFSIAYPHTLISAITNGFDTENNLSISTKLKFRILYAGSFYGHYNPSNFLLAIKQSAQENLYLNKSLDLIFIGNYPQNIIDMFQSYQKYFSIDFKQFKSPIELEKEFLTASVLLVILPGEDHYKAYLPAKLFTYLAKHLPILALIPDGEAKVILEKSNLGFFADPGSVASIKNELLRIFNLWKSNRLQVEPNIEYIQQFHRRNLTKQLASILNSMVN